jgi:hypothetical protein
MWELGRKPIANLIFFTELRSDSETYPVYRPGCVRRKQARTKSFMESQMRERKQISVNGPAGYLKSYTLA